MYSLNFQKRNCFCKAIVDDWLTQSLENLFSGLWDVGEHRVLNASTESLQFCYPPSLLQEACTSLLPSTQPP